MPWTEADKIYGSIEMRTVLLMHYCSFFFRSEGLRIVWAAQVEGAWAWGTPGAPRVWGSCSRPPPPLASTQPQPPRAAQAAGAGGCRGSWSGAREA